MQHTRSGVERGLQILMPARALADGAVRSLDDVGDPQDLRFGRATQAESSPSARDGRLLDGLDVVLGDARLEPLREGTRRSPPLGLFGSHCAGESLALLVHLLGGLGRWR